MVSLLRQLTQNIYIQTAFHVAGGTGFGLFLAGFMGEARPWLAVGLMSLAVVGHIIAVAVETRAPKPE